jgi:hypothetical protein
MSKTTLLAILFGLTVLGVLVYSTLQLGQWSCEVCMTYNGMDRCATAAAPAEAEARRAATDTACAVLASGMTESLQCTNTPPKSVNCRQK